jgi:CRP/FNR family cyclic AMP-dependent transcriptional regulator
VTQDRFPRLDDRVAGESSPPSWQSLLDLDPDLAGGLDAQMWTAARAAAISRTFRVDPGRLPFPDWLAATAHGPGVLILDGVLCVSVRSGDRIAAELVGSGDLIHQISPEHDEMLSCDVSWRALTPSRLALLDGGFAKRVRFWPQIHQALLGRAARRCASLNVQRAIASEPRLEMRLTLLLWHLAARWGKTERGGVRVPLPLTHHLLGQLIGAERPSVTHALTRLAHARVITGHNDEWHLHGSLEDQLQRWRERSSRQMAVGMGAFRTG